MSLLKTLSKDIFDYNVRINRLRFALYAIPLFLIFLFSGLMGSVPEDIFITTETITNLSYAIMYICFIFLSFLFVKRIHDLDWSAWWLLLIFFVPISLFVLGGILLFKKGTDGKNRFGDDPLKAV